MDAESACSLVLLVLLTVVDSTSCSSVVFVLVELPLEGLLVTEVQFVHVFGFFEKVRFHEVDSVFALAFKQCVGLLCCSAV